MAPEGKAFKDRINALREVRNELMHFNDKVGDTAIPMLRHMIELLREYGDCRTHPLSRPCWTGC